MFQPFFNQIVKGQNKLIKNKDCKTTYVKRRKQYKFIHMKGSNHFLQKAFRLLIIFFHRDLQKHRLKKMNAIVMRDSLRNEMAKQQRLEEEMREKREQQKMDMQKLNLMINQGEEQMVKLRKRYEKNVQHRNDRLVLSLWCFGTCLFYIPKILEKYK